MATLSDRPDHGHEGGTASLSREDVLCPHCGTLMASGAELPWPGEPVMCEGCERWVGRGRAVPSAPPSGKVDTGPDGAERPLEADRPHDSGLDALPPEERLSRPSRHRPARPGPIELRRARELGPPPVPTASASSERLRAPVEDSPAASQPGESSGSPATAGYDNGAAHLPPDAGPHRPPAPDFDRPSPSRSAGPDGAAPGETVAFPAQTDEGKRRPRFALPRLRRPVLRRPTRAGLMRKLPVILVVAGALLLLEGALTVLWKEPFSALFASQVQGALGDDLEAREAEAAREAAKGRRNALQYMRRRAVSLNRELGPDDPVGRLRIKKIGLSTVVVQSTTLPSLTKGPGHYRETPLPGQKGNWTVGIAGHRTTYDAPFRNIDKLDRGDEIVFTLPYGRFTYEVEGTKIVDDSETGVFIPKGYDRIALTACHPLYSDAQRIIAYGKLKESKPRGGAKIAAAKS